MGKENRVAVDHLRFSRPGFVKESFMGSYLPSEEPDAMETEVTRPLLEVEEIVDIDFTFRKTLVDQQEVVQVSCDPAAGKHAIRVSTPQGQYVCRLPDTLAKVLTDFLKKQLAEIQGVLCYGPSYDGQAVLKLVICGMQKWKTFMEKKLTSHGFSPKSVSVDSKAFAGKCVKEIRQKRVDEQMAASHAVGVTAGPAKGHRYSPYLTSNSRLANDRRRMGTVIKSQGGVLTNSLETPITTPWNACGAGSAPNLNRDGVIKTAHVKFFEGVSCYNSQEDAISQATLAGNSEKTATNGVCVKEQFMRKALSKATMFDSGPKLTVQDVSGSLNPSAGVDKTKRTLRYTGARATSGDNAEVTSEILQASGMYQRIGPQSEAVSSCPPSPLQSDKPSAPPTDSSQIFTPIADLIQCGISFGNSSLTYSQPLNSPPYIKNFDMLGTQQHISSPPRAIVNTSCTNASNSPQWTSSGRNNATGNITMPAQSILSGEDQNADRSSSPELKTYDGNSSVEDQSTDRSLSPELEFYVKSSSEEDQSTDRSSSPELISYLGNSSVEEQSTDRCQLLKLKSYLGNSPVPFKLGKSVDMDCTMSLSGAQTNANIPNLVSSNFTPGCASPPYITRFDMLGSQPGISSPPPAIVNTLPAAASSHPQWTSSSGRNSATRNNSVRAQSILSVGNQSVGRSLLPELKSSVGNSSEEDERTDKSSSSELKSYGGNSSEEDQRTDRASLPELKSYVGNLSVPFKSGIPVDIDCTVSMSGAQASVYIPSQVSSNFVPVCASPAPVNDTWASSDIHGPLDMALEVSLSETSPCKNNPMVTYVNVSLPSDAPNSEPVLTTSLDAFKDRGVNTCLPKSNFVFSPDAFDNPQRHTPADVLSTNRPKLPFEETGRNTQTGAPLKIDTKFQSGGACLDLIDSVMFGQTDVFKMDTDFLLSQQREKNSGYDQDRPSDFFNMPTVINMNKSVTGAATCELVPPFPVLDRGDNMPSCSADILEPGEPEVTEMWDTETGVRTYVSPEEMKNELDKLFEDDLIEGDKTTEMNPSKAIKTTLYPHQKQALRWMIHRENSFDPPPFWRRLKSGKYCNRFMGPAQQKPDCVNGGILADDMGLGKTLSIISVILTNYQKEQPLFEPRNGYTPASRKRSNSQQTRTVPTATTSATTKTPHHPLTTQNQESPGSARKLLKLSRSPSLVTVKKEEPKPKARRSLSDFAICNMSPTRPPIGLTESDSDCDLPDLPDLDDSFEPSNPVRTEGPLRPNTGGLPDLSRTRTVVDVKPSCALTPNRKRKVSSISERKPRVPVVQTPESQSGNWIRNSTDGPSATLIVCPLAVLDGWQDQIRLHVHESVPLRVCVHHGTSRTKVPENLAKNDVVITTYQTLSRETKSENSPLQKVHWLRVVLDEGHIIRNPNTGLHKAAIQLQADRRWVLTGTPIQNYMRDLWSLINFLRVSPFTERLWWRRVIEIPLKNGDKRGVKRVRHLLCNCAMRRVKTQKVNGKPLVALPAKHVYTETVKMREEEKAAYDEMQQWGRVVISRYYDEGTLVKHYSEVLVILLRLRQLCCHRLLVAKSIVKGATPGIPHLNGKFKGELGRLPGFLGGSSQKTVSDSSPSSSGDTPPPLSVSAQNDSCSPIYISDSDSDSATSCDSPDSSMGAEVEHSCTAIPNDNGPIILKIKKEKIIPQKTTACESDSWSQELKAKQEIKVFCKACMEEVTITQDDPNPPCRICGQKVSKEEFVALPEEGTLRANLPIDQWPPSTKIVALMKALINLRKQDPSIKSMVVSQFTSFLDVLQIFLEKQKFKFGRLDGTMNTKQRWRQIQKFSEPGADSPTIFLMSLTAGGVGINLTAASRIFLMDPAWNPATEDQCFDRCHRLGQTKDVIVTRYVVEDTVENWMLELQDKKRKLMQEALTHPMTAAQRQQHTIEHITRLFDL